MWTLISTLLDLKWKRMKKDFVVNHDKNRGCQKIFAAGGF